MSSSDESCYSPTTSEKKYKGVRRRKWGKWVSEIRVPGTQERLWLGSYVSPEAAAVAHDIAYYCLRNITSSKDFNFPLVLPAGVDKGMSPLSVQKAATDAGMAVDAQLLSRRAAAVTALDMIKGGGGSSGQQENGSSSISVEDYLLNEYT